MKRAKSGIGGKILAYIEEKNPRNWPVLSPACGKLNSITPFEFQCIQCSFPRLLYPVHHPVVTPILAPIISYPMPIPALHPLYLSTYINPAVIILRSSKSRN